MGSNADIVSFGITPSSCIMPRTYKYDSIMAVLTPLFGATSLHLHNAISITHIRRCLNEKVIVSLLSIPYYVLITPVLNKVLPRGLRPGLDSEA
jgi:hypothetical protein